MANAAVNADPGNAERPAERPSLTLTRRLRARPEKVYAAWTHAEILWELRRSSFLEDRYVDTLGHIVGLAGRGLLVATL